MELLKWFKKPVKWWVGLLLIVLGTILMRQVYVWEWAQPVGGATVFVGIVMVLLFGRVRTETNEES
jgi:membrane-bound ClpP family serine protease